MLVLSNGELVTVEWVQHEILESPIKVYNFEVEDFHTYFVGENGVFVHNGCGGRLGKEETRAQNREIADTLESKGYTVTGGGGYPKGHEKYHKEEYLAGRNGKRMSTDSIRFFATKKDMISYFEGLSNKVILYDDLLSYKIDDTIPIYSSIEEIPHLGFTKDKDHGFAIYTVISKESRLEEKEFLTNGEKKKRISRGFDADAVHFCPSGINTKEKCIIHGQINLISNSIYARKIFNQLYYRIKKHSTGFWG